MLQRVEIHLVRDHRRVEERGRQQFACQNTGLVKVQAARPREDHRSAGIDSGGFVPLAIEVGQPTCQGLQNILDAQRIVFPTVCR